MSTFKKQQYYNHLNLVSLQLSWRYKKLLNRYIIEGGVAFYNMAVISNGQHCALA